MAWTFTTLKSAIQDYVESSETTFTDNLSVFIKEAEERILKNIQIPVFRKNVTGSGTSGNTYLAAPSDFLTPLSLAVIDSDSNYNYLLLYEIILRQQQQQENLSIMQYLITILFF